MKDELFDELLEGVRQGGAILRGEIAPGRAFRFDEEGVPDVGAEQARQLAEQGAWLSLAARDAILKGR